MVRGQRWWGLMCEVTVGEVVEVEVKVKEEEEEVVVCKVALPPLSHLLAQRRARRARRQELGGELSRSVLRPLRLRAARR